MGRVCVDTFDIEKVKAQSGGKSYSALRREDYVHNYKASADYNSTILIQNPCDPSIHSSPKRRIFSRSSISSIYSANREGSFSSVSSSLFSQNNHTPSYADVFEAEEEKHDSSGRQASPFLNPRHRVMGSDSRRESGLATAFEINENENRDENDDVEEDDDAEEEEEEEEEEEDDENENDDDDDDNEDDEDGMQTEENEDVQANEIDDDSSTDEDDRYDTLGSFHTSFLTRYTNPSLSQSTKKFKITVYRCKKCYSDICISNLIISKDFWGNNGEAYFVKDVLNVREDSKEVLKNMRTGKYGVKSIYCVQCNKSIGWKYITSVEPSESYKVDKYVIEKNLLKSCRISQ